MARPPAVTRQIDRSGNEDLLLRSNAGEIDCDSSARELGRDEPRSPASCLLRSADLRRDKPSLSTFPDEIVGSPGRSPGSPSAEDVTTDAPHPPHDVST
jgi:hypothetical protein